MIKKLRRAFTIVELVIIIAVIAVLAAVLIPTFSNIINKSQISADQTNVTNLNKQISIELVDGKIESAEDLERVIVKVFGQEYYDNLAPKSAKLGYNYWFNIKTNLVELKKYDESFVSERANLSMTTKSFDENNFRRYGDYYLLDQTGSDFSDAIKGFETLTSSDSYMNAITLVNNILSNENNHHYVQTNTLIDKLSKTVIIGNAGTFRYADYINVTNVLFVSGITTINSNLYLYDGTNVISITPSQTNPVANVSEITLPSTITSVEGNALYFKENKTVNIYGSFKTIDEVKSIFKAYSTNGIIVCEESDGLVLNGSVLEDLNGNSQGNLGYSNPVASFDISCEETDKIKYVSGTLYVAYDQKEFQLMTDNFIGENPNSNISSEEVFWSSDNSDVLSVDENGKVTIEKIPSIGETTEYTLTATSIAGGHQETITVRVVRINSAYLEFEGTDIFSDVDSTIEVTYDGTKESFSFSNFAAYYNYTVVDLVLESEVVVETTGDLFTVNGLTLTLSENQKSGTQTITIKIGEYITKNITINVIDNTASAFDRNYIIGAEGEDGSLQIGEKYLYRVGNENTVLLGELFNNVKAAKNVFLTIYDLTSSVNSDVLIGADPNFTVIIKDKNNNELTMNNGWTLEQEDWSEASIKFEGTGIAKIEIGNKIGNTYEGKSFIIVEVVDGKNVRAYSDLNSSGNYVLLNDIKMSDNGSYYLSNGTLFGNGYTFDVTKGIVSGSGYVTSNYLIGLNNANLDNIIVVGAVYTTINITSKSNYNRPVVLTTGTCGIYNSYISNAASPVRAQSGNLTIENSTLKGGALANLDIRGGNVNIKNVTTINQVNGNDKSVDGKTIIGLGIVIWYEGPNGSEKINIEGLTQYNYVSSSQTSNVADTDGDTYDTKTLVKLIFEKVDSKYKKSYDGDEWVNTGILCLNEKMEKNNFSTLDGYSWSSISYANKTCTLYTQPGEYYDNPLIYGPAYVLTEQYYIKASHQIEFPIAGNKNYLAATDNCKNSCLYMDNKILMSIEKDSSIDFDLSIISAMKNDNLLSVSAKVDGVSYNLNSIINFTSDDEGEHIIEYSYVDPYNYRLAGDKIVSYDVTYTVKIYIDIISVDKTIPEATFDFNGNGYRKEIIDGITYIMPNVTSTSDTIVSKTIGGKNIYIPKVYTYYTNGIVGQLKQSDQNTSLNASSGMYTTIYCQIFNGVITIKDNGTIYDSSTTSLDSCNLTLVDDGGGLKWAASGNAPTENPVNKNNKLFYQSITIDGGNARSRRSYEFKYKYDDEAGNTYYYFISYVFPETTVDGGCVADGTLITLADGTQVPVENIKGNEMLLVWDYVTGAYTSSKIAYIVNHNNQKNEQQVINLKFSNGINIEMIGEHGFYSIDLEKWVYITSSNVDQYIGNSFVSSYTNDSNLWTEVTLVDYDIYEKVTGVYEIVTYGSLSCYTNGLLSVSGYTGGLLDMFEVNADTMAYDLDLMQEDIEKYGLFTYEDFKELVSEQVFEMYNAKYLKVAIGKGLMTWEDVLDLIDVYNNNDIKPIE